MFCLTVGTNVQKSRLPLIHNLYLPFIMCKKYTYYFLNQTMKCVQGNLMQHCNLLMHHCTYIAYLRCFHKLCLYICIITRMLHIRAVVNIVDWFKLTVSELKFFYLIFENGCLSCYVIVGSTFERGGAYFNGVKFHLCLLHSLFVFSWDCSIFRDRL